jgi:tRNA pseudouridine13 synthase
VDEPRGSAAWPLAHGPAPATGRVRLSPEDFQVEELLGFEPDGAGSHALLTVEKREANTGWVAAQLAGLAGCHVRDVGFSGQKDRHAVTRQAYSVPLPAQAEVADCTRWQGEGYRVVAAARHGRKLRPGSHRGNRFVVTVRELAGDAAGIEARLAAMQACGVPNYFGPQRFGRNGSNLDRARDWAAHGRAPRDRAQRGFALSAARSHLFNRVLAERVRRGDWNRLLPGEAVQLDGSRSFFIAETVDESLLTRLQAMDLHPSGPLPGDADSPALNEALAVERAALDGEAALLELLRRERLAGERRSLRLPLRGLHAVRDAGAATLRLEFGLPRGAFATAVLHELLADAWDDAGGADD